jgi:hypothetical protein
MLTEELQSSPQSDDSSIVRDEHDHEAAPVADAVEGSHQCHEGQPTPPPMTRNVPSPSATPPDVDSTKTSPCGDDSQSRDTVRDANGALKRKDHRPQESNGAHAPRKRGRESKDDAAAPTASPIPILCTHLSRDVFEVIRVRGKSLASGGFGFVTVGRRSLIASEKEAPGQATPNEETSAERDNAEGGSSPNAQSSNTHSPAVTATEHLFLEEVLFLHERGLLECRDRPDAASRSTLASQDPVTDHAPAVSSAWDAFRLYSMLNHDDTVSLPVYLVYAHLRKQGFRVVRHTPHRRALLEEQQQQQQQQGEQAGATSADGDADGRESSRSSDRRRQLLLREDAARAAPPALFGLAWDVYQPNSQFRRARPGLPDFYAAVAMYNAPMKMQRILDLVDECRGIPFQIGTVSASGQVVMMGIHDFAAPRIERVAAGGAAASDYET